MPGKISFTLTEYKMTEGGVWKTVQVGVERTESSVGLVNVKLSNTSSTSPGRATRNRDYTAPASQILAWADGELGTKFMEISVLQDESVEKSETINLTLSSIVNAEYGSIKTAQLIIVDDDFLIPAHEWQGTSLRFQNPDGSWGQFVDLSIPGS